MKAKATEAELLHLYSSAKYCAVRLAFRANDGRAQVIYSVAHSLTRLLAQPFAIETRHQLLRRVVAIAGW